MSFVVNVNGSDLATQTTLADLDSKIPLGLTISGGRLLVDISGSSVITGAVTANAGTNLNTSLLALEGGGNLAAINAKIPALGQALAVGSVPVVLTAAQLSTLTPLSTIAVTGTFWQATQPVSGTFWQATQPVSIATMPSTPVTGTFWQATQPVSGTIAATQSGTWDIGTLTALTSITNPVAVTGTFWQSTQPVSLTTLPALVAGTAVIGHVIVDTAPSTAVTNAGTFAVQATLGAGSNVIGHVIVDTAPSTAVTNTGTFAVQASLANETTKVIGTVNQGTSPWSDNISQINGVTPLMGAGNSGTGSQRATNASAGTGTLSNVASSASNVTLLASNSSRLGATIFNDSTSAVYVKFGTTASATSFTVKIQAGGYYEMPTPHIYSGNIDGIWVSANGNARVTEMT